MPVTVVPTSSATVAIETFITELSSVIRNWPAASVSRTRVAPPARGTGVASEVAVTGAILSQPGNAHRLWVPGDPSSPARDNHLGELELEITSRPPDRRRSDRARGHRG